MSRRQCVVGADGRAPVGTSTAPPIAGRLMRASVGACTTPLVVRRCGEIRDIRGKIVF